MNLYPTDSVRPPADARPGRESTRHRAIVFGFTSLAIHSAFRFSFGVMLPPMVADLGGGLTAITVAYTVHMAIYTITAPLAGRLYERYSPYRLVLIGSGVAATVLVLLAFVTTSWQVVALFGVLAAPATHGFGPIAATMPAIRAYPDKAGFALGMTMGGVNVGTMLFTTLSGLVVATLGWRAAWAVLGVTAVIVLPIVTVLSKAYLNRASIERASTPAPGLWTVRSFVTLALAFAMAMFVYAGIAIHMPTLGLERGVPLEMAGLTVGALAGIGLVGRLLFGGISDRMQIRLDITPILGLIGVVGLAVAGWSQSLTGYWGSVGLLGLGLSVYGGIMGAVVAEAFPTRPYSRVMGSLLVATGAGAASGPLALSAATDAGLTTRVQFGGLIAVLGGATGLFWLARGNARRTGAAPRHQGRS